MYSVTIMVYARLLDDARCVCIDSCPQYKEPVCSSSGTTYDNTCLFKQEMCLLQLNYTVQHPGSCEGIRLLNSYLWSLNPVEGGYFLKQLPYEKGVLFTLQVYKRVGNLLV